MRYVRFYDKATAPIPGTDTPVAILPVGNGQRYLELGDMAGIRFNQGIGMAFTVQADLQNAAGIAANDLVAINVLYS